MPRLIFRPTWLHVCHTLGCHRMKGSKKPTVFDELHCSTCGRRFDPRKMRVVAPERLILIGAAQITHERVAVCRCGRCEDVYDLEDKQWWDPTLSAHCHCQACHKPIWQPEELDFLCDEDMTNFDRATKIEEWRALIKGCRLCGARFQRIPWCPLCANEPLPPAESGLPRERLMVWRRITGTNVSLEEQQTRAHEDQKQKEQDAQTSAWLDQDSDALPDPDTEKNKKEDTQDEPESN